MTDPQGFDEFNKWLDTEFIKRNGGFFPNFIKLWYNAVDKNHVEIRKLIDGKIVQRFYKLKSHQKAIEEKEASDYIDAILKVLPTYLSDNGFDKGIFLLPTIPRGSHNAIRVSKHVKTFADYKYKNGYISNADYKSLDKPLSILGDLWAKSRTTETEVEITLSTTQKGFALLGHYGPDKDSCFRQDSDKPTQKYILAQSPETFVITISKYNEKKKKNINVARCFGFLNKDLNTVGLANYYFSPKFQEGDALEAIRLLFSDIWKDDVEVHEEGTYFNSDIVWQNPYFKYAVTKGKGSKLKSRATIQFNYNGILYCTCDVCKRQNCHTSDCSIVDEDTICCHRCIGKASVCEITRQYTFKPLVQFLNKEGVLLSVHEKFAEQYKKCTNCNCLHEESNEIDSNILCNDCVEYIYSSCSNCDNMVKDSDLIDIGSEEICKECFEKSDVPVDYDIFLNISKILGAK